MSKFKKILDLSQKAENLIYQQHFTFQDIYQEIMGSASDNLAFIYHRDNDLVREYTYTQYNDLVISTSKKLNTAFKNLKFNDIVALKFKNSPTWCILFWSILRCGFRPLLIDAKLPYKNTQVLLQNAKAKAIICNENNEYYNAQLLNTDSIHSYNGNNNYIPKWANEIMFCSSGTTGNIKIMIFNGKNMVYQLLASKNMPRKNLNILYPQSIRPLRIIALIPLHHIFAFVAIFLWYSFFNSTIVFTSSNDPLSLIKDIRNFKVTHIYHVPLFFDVVAKNFSNHIKDNEKEKVKKLIDYNLGKINGSPIIKLTERTVKNKLFGTQVRFMISGGGYFNPKTSDILNGIGYKLYNGFGMTEIGVSSVELTNNVFTRCKGSIGRPLYGFSYKLNKKNELLVHSNTIHVREIIDGIESDTKLDEDGYFSTGDIALKEIDNRYYIKGRIKDVIITSNGENVYPDEIESYFKKIKGYNNLTVFGNKNKIILIVETNSNDLENEFVNVNKTLPIHKQANEIIFTNIPLPLSSSMKVKRFVVKDNYEKGMYKTNMPKKKVDILSGYDSIKKNIVVDKLKKIFQNVLFTKEDIDGDAHFINDLHSDSMTYVTLIGEIEKEFNYKIDINKYGQLTCLNDFAKELLDSDCK